MLTLLKYKADVHKSFGGGDRLPVSIPLIPRRAEPSVSRHSSLDDANNLVYCQLSFTRVMFFHQICSFYKLLERYSPTTYFLIIGIISINSTNHSVHYKYFRLSHLYSTLSRRHSLFNVYKHNLT